MKQILEFNPTNVTDGTTPSPINVGMMGFTFKISPPAGSLFRCRIYNQSPVNIVVRFGDTNGSNDFLPAYKSKYYQVAISQPIIGFGICGTFSAGQSYDNLFVNTNQDVVKVIQYEDGETVFDTLEHDLLPPQILVADADFYQIAQSTTIEFTIPFNLQPATPAAATPGFIVVPDGLDITCQAVTTAQKLVIHVNDFFGGITILDYELRQLTTDNLREYIRFPPRFLAARGPQTYSVKVFALAFGAQQIDLNIYYHVEMGAVNVLPSIS